MAMLAEKKVKEKWCQDPRNTRWSKAVSGRVTCVVLSMPDPGLRYTSKYGYRMLQRMGWEEGKGLGSKEEGLKEHIKVSVKRDNSGLGRKKRRDDDWIEHQDTFDQILANLSAQSVASPKRTEDSSQNTKALLETATDSKRLLYKKFLKSKDLSAQSSEDLDCVFGRKRRKVSAEKEQKFCDGGIESRVGATAVSGITTITNHQSIQDYFATKLSASRQSAPEEVNRDELADDRQKLKRKIKKRTQKSSSS